MSWLHQTREYRLVPHLEYADVLEIATWDKGASSGGFGQERQESEKWPYRARLSDSCPSVRMVFREFAGRWD